MTVEQMLNIGAKTTTKHKVYGSAVQAAAIAGCVSVPPLPRDRGVDLYARGGAWEDPLSAAYKNGSLLGMEYLLTMQGHTPMPLIGKYSEAYHAARANAQKEKTALFDTYLPEFAAVYQAVLRGQPLSMAADTKHRFIVDEVMRDLGDSCKAAAFLDQHQTVSLLIPNGVPVGTTGGNLALRSIPPLSHVKWASLLCFCRMVHELSRRHPTTRRFVQHA